LIYPVPKPSKAKNPFGGTRGTDCRQTPVTNDVSVRLGSGLINKSRKLPKKAKTTVKRPM
jgi:hypothetical protein